jgi:hypothetical protein
MSIGTVLLLLASLAAQERPPAVYLRLEPPADRSLLRGTPAKLYLRTDRGAYVTVFRADTEGRLSVLYPERPWEDNYLRPGKNYEIASAGTGYTFTVESEPGVGYLFAVASAEAFDYRRVVRGERWDHAALLPEGRITGDPYASFVGLAERIVEDRGTPYGSALLAYRVEGEYDYPRFVCYGCHAPASREVWDPYGRTCSRFALVRYSDPEAGYRYAFRDLRAPSGESGRDWISGVLDLRRLIPWVSKSAEVPRPPERAAEAAPSPSSLPRNLTPRLERRLVPVPPQSSDSPPVRNEKRRRPQR